VTVGENGRSHSVVQIKKDYGPQKAKSCIFCSILPEHSVFTIPFLHLIYTFAIINMYIKKRILA